MDHQGDDPVTSDLEKPHSSSADEIENIRPEEASRICCKHCVLNFSRREVFDEVKNLISHSWLLVSNECTVAPCMYQYTVIFSF